jgi:hypothetical protein
MKPMLLAFSLYDTKGPNKQLWGNLVFMFYCETLLAVA